MEIWCRIHQNKRTAGCSIQFIIVNECIENKIILILFKMQLFEKRLETDSDGVNGCSAEVSKFFCVAI